MLVVLPWSEFWANNYFAAAWPLVRSIVTNNFVRGGVSGIDQRSRYIETLADIERTSLDYYATIRSLYRQRRAAQIRHEEENLPNPTPVQGSNARPAPSMSYSIARLPQSQQSWPK